MIFRHISVSYNSSSQNEGVVTFLENQCWFKKHIYQNLQQSYQGRKVMGRNAPTDSLTHSNA